MEHRLSLRAIVLGLTFVIIWSSAFATARVIVQHVPPMTALTFRFALSGLIALAIARAMGQSLRIGRGQWRAVIVFGVCQNALYLGLNFTAMQWIDAALAAIIASSLPLLVALASVLFRLDKITPLSTVGLCLGFGGVVIIMSARLSEGSQTLGMALCVTAAVALAIATLSMRSASAGGNLMTVVGYQMLVGCTCVGVAAALFETPSMIYSHALVAAMSYQILFPGVLATLIWFILVRDIGAIKASSFHFLNPFFGVLIAALLLSEQVTVQDMVGVAIISAGILCVQLARFSRQRDNS